MSVDSMATHSHNTSSSSNNALTAGVSYQLILEHVLSFPATYEIPLRSMYTLNAAPRTRPGTPSHSPCPSPMLSSFPQNNPREAAQAATVAFQSSLVTQIQQLPSQPCSLPPIFIIPFLRRCFPPELSLVDFPQALTGLDYLKDLETRRRREVAASLSRLGIDKTNLVSQLAKMSHSNPGVVKWFDDCEGTERKIESLYTQLYVGLRRWILINELSLLPFNKHNCLAMLNTLYPPLPSTSLSPDSARNSPTPAPMPTRILTPTIMSNQRSGFFKYIRAVENRGTTVLATLMQQGKGSPGDENAWPAMREGLDAYLRIANHVFEESNEVQSLDDFDRHGLKLADKSPQSYTDESRGGRKADSGVSFGSDSTKRPSTSSGSDSSIAKKSLKSPPPVPLALSTQAPPGRKNLSTLEKIARELRKIKTSRSNSNLNEDKENLYLAAVPPTPLTSGFPHSAHLEHQKKSSGSSSGSRNEYRLPHHSQESSNSTNPPLSPQQAPVRTRFRALSRTRTFSRNTSRADDPEPTGRASTNTARPSFCFSRPSSSMSNLAPTQSGGAGKTALRRLRSLGDMKGRGRASISYDEDGSEDAPERFDPAQMAAQRRQWEKRERERARIQGRQSDLLV